MSDKKKNNEFFNNDLVLRILILAVPSYLLYKIYVFVKTCYLLHPKTFQYIIYAIVVFTLLTGTVFLWNCLLRFVYKSKDESLIERKILVGFDEKGRKPIYIGEKARLSHTQVIGSTGSGKTEGIIMPWIFDDIENGRGLLIIDGKPEEKNLIRLYGKISKEGREKDFKLFSLVRPDLSHSFNPFAYGTPSEVTERIFSSFQTENEHYKALQYSSTSTVIELIKTLGRIPTAGLLRELMRNKKLLEIWAEKISDPQLNSDIDKLLNVPDVQFQKDFSGILAYFENFTKGEVAKILNQTYSQINFEEALLNKNIIYFQLPTLKSPTLASALGRLAIQTFASAAGEIQGRSRSDPDSLFSIYLDDFNDYMYPGFASVANKVRSAGIGMVFAHQSLGDLNKVSPDFKDIIVENTNNKIILKINDPESAEFFSSYIGTRKTEKLTERRTRKLFGSEDTGEQSVRETEEFIIHPNTFKSEFGPGDAVAIVTNSSGPRGIYKIKCKPIERNSDSFLPKTISHPNLNFVQEAQRFSAKTSLSETPNLSVLATPQPEPSSLSEIK